MSIDVKEWAERRRAQFMSGSDGWEQETKVTVALIRAVIADEAAKAAPQPEGDVPEWFTEAIRDEWFATDEEIAKQYRLFTSELLTKAVAEATADKDRRIGELEAECERLNILIQATAEAWLSLEPGVAWEGAIDAAMKAGVGEIQKLRQQLAERDVEIERLRKHLSSEQGRFEATRLDAVALTKEMNGMRQQITKLQAELAECRKPVEGIQAIAARHFHLQDRVVTEEQYQREHNARVASDKRAEEAERRLGEMREFVKAKIVNSYTGSRTYFDTAKRHSAIPDAELDKLIAAFRAEKWKVQQ